MTDLNQSDSFSSMHTNKQNLGSYIQIEQEICKPIPEWIKNHFEKIYIDQKSIDSFVAQRVLKHFPSHKIEIVSNLPLLETQGTLSKEQFEHSKKNLFITPFQGQFFKRCPGATQKKTLTCCNYYILNLGSQCNMNCSYCYLQSYLNTPIMKIYSNIEQALHELEEMALDHQHLPYRVGTGEVIDSLSLDELTLYSRILISFFKKYPKWILEFKTKSKQVEQFLDMGPAQNTVASWSLNADYISRTEEHGTASLEERLRAARKCLNSGFSLSFHLDPVIWHPKWKENYADLVDQITSKFKPEEILVLSLGTLRFQPEQKHIMRERFGMKSYVTQAEMFPSEGDKLRYDSRLRKEMFDFILNRFKESSPEWKIFLCMETPETWIATYENTPMNIQGLHNFFRPLPKIKSEVDFEPHLV